jgi:hypothetical protein
MPLSSPSIDSQPSRMPFKDRCKLLIARLLIKLGKLRFDDFTKEELHELIADLFPHRFPLNIPIGTGSVNVQEGEIAFDNENNKLVLQCLATINIDVANNTLYRAHLVVVSSAKPQYDEISKTVLLTHVNIDTITLVNDNYALIQDSRYLLNKFFPQGINNLVTSSLRSAMSLFTVGTSDVAADYLKLYLSGSKQAVLDYHKPQINQAIQSELNTANLSHTMRESHWREALFARVGKSVRVEDDRLRFYLV